MEAISVIKSLCVVMALVIRWPDRRGRDVVFAYGFIYCLQSWYLPEPAGAGWYALNATIDIFSAAVMLAIGNFQLSRAMAATLAYCAAVNVLAMWEFDTAGRTIYDAYATLIALGAAIEVAALLSADTKESTGAKRRHA